MLMKFNATIVRRGRRAVAARAEGVECHCAQVCTTVLATHLRIDNQQDPIAVSSIVICNVKDCQASPSSFAVKDEKMIDADPEQAKQKKQKLKKKGQKGEEDKEADLSEEDLELKKNLELMLERAKDSDAGVQRTALDGIAREIR